MATLNNSTTQPLRTDNGSKSTEVNMEKDVKLNVVIEDIRDTKLLFTVDSMPPWPILILYAVQVDLNVGLII